MEFMFGVLGSPMLVNDNASVFTFFSEVCANGDPFTQRVRETRAKTIKVLAKDEGTTAPYAGYQKDR